MNNFDTVRRFQKRLIEVFRMIPRDRDSLKMWNKSAVINRINDTFSDFITEELDAIANQIENQPPLQNYTEEVKVPEWEPEVQQPESEETGETYD